MTIPTGASAVRLLASLRAGEASPRELAAAHMERISEAAQLNAFLWADPDRVLAAAPHARVATPLAGLPLAIKDNIDTAGIPTTSGSLVDARRVPATDASVWRRLRDEAGAVLLGKAHMCEFAYRAHHPVLGWVRNPRNPDRATGGSSSGSAAAVAAGLAPAALGTDTGGSVRIPASYCGVVGFKPSGGLIENDGLVPLSTTMDHYGVLASSVADAALVLQEMLPGRPCLIDSRTLETRPAKPDRLRVGVERGYFGSGAQPAVLECWGRAVCLLEGAGCAIVDIELLQAARWRAAHKRILLHEAWTYHAARLTAGAPFGPVFKEAISAASLISEGQYRTALALRDQARQVMAAIFGDLGVDVMLTPTTPTVAPAIEEGRRSVSYTRYTTLAAFAALPAVSLPAGAGYRGLPVGLQLIAGPNQERKLVGAAALLEGLLGGR